MTPLATNKFRRAHRRGADRRARGGWDGKNTLAAQKSRPKERVEPTEPPAFQLLEISFVKRGAGAVTGDILQALRDIGAVARVMIELQLDHRMMREAIVPAQPGGGSIGAYLAVQA